MQQVAINQKQPTIYYLNFLAYRKLVGECKQNGAKCIITKYDAKGQPKVDKRKSIIDRKSNRGGRKSSELSDKSIKLAGNSNSENKENDEKMLYAKKSSPKENPKKSTKAMKSVVGEKGSKPGQKSIDDLMSEVVGSNGKYFCPEKCGKWYTNKNPIKKHLLSHRPKSEWPWVCLFCGRHFQVGLSVS